MQHQVLLDRLAKFPVQVLRADHALETADAVIAEFTQSSEEQVARVHYVAKQLGKPLCF